RRLRGALANTTLLGLKTNQACLAHILNQPAFLSGETTTSFLVEHGHMSAVSTDKRALSLVAAALARYRTDAGDGPGYWRNNPGTPAPYRFRVGDEAIDVILRPERWLPNRFSATLSSGESVIATIDRFDGVEMALITDGVRHRFILAVRGGDWWVKAGWGALQITALPLLPAPRRSADMGRSLRAPMPGRVLAVLVEVGQLVEEGQPLMKLEAMKMEHTIRAAAAGVVDAVYYAVGDQVGADETLVRIAG
ncbi:MAG TPA: biotin/lipoyl-binding protein, partial [Promineifilum sp.]|nr:biotin/lipoyl-binding protein [Promineifilum sp.]